jgi:hypothetical protein
MSIPADRIRLKRAYEPAAPEDGTRVLVEALTPRGVEGGGRARGLAEGRRPEPRLAQMGRK